MEPTRRDFLKGVGVAAALPYVAHDVMSDILATSRRGNAYNNVIDFTTPDRQTDGRIIVHGAYRGEPERPQRFVVDFTGMGIQPRGATTEAALRAGLGLEAGQALSADMKPPKLSSDVIYLDDELRINVGSLGGLYLLKRSDEAPVSI